MFPNSLFFCECIINIFKGGLLGHLTAAAAAGDQTGNLQIRWNWKRKGRVALYLSTVSPCMVATDLRKDLAVAMTPNLTAQEQPRSVYIHQSSRPSAWLTCTCNGARLSTCTTGTWWRRQRWWWRRQRSWRWWCYGSWVEDSGPPEGTFWHRCRSWEAGDLQSNRGCPRPKVKSVEKIWLWPPCAYKKCLTSKNNLSRVENHLLIYSPRWPSCSREMILLTFRCKDCQPFRVERVK